MKGGEVKCFEVVKSSGIEGVSKEGSLGGSSNGGAIRNRLVRGFVLDFACEMQQTLHKRTRRVRVRSMYAMPYKPRPSLDRSDDLGKLGSPFLLLRYPDVQR